MGTLASFARLPIKEVVVRSSTKVGEIVNVTTGGEEDGGGVCTVIYIKFRAILVNLGFAY